ncbi:MAG: hypothetical protein L0177_05725 [Chloroflexi bacterium]|nr:hypothetical protein [Chloroflexota bacterium]
MAATPTPSPAPAPASTPTALIVPPTQELKPVAATGLLATVPGYASIDTSEAARLIELAYPGRVPKSVQLLLLLTQDDQAFVVVALDTTIDRFVTAGSIEGLSLPSPQGLPAELDFASRVIVSDSVRLMEPVRATPGQVIQSPESYAFKRVAMDTTYLFSGARLKDPPPSLEHIGVGVATDNLGSQSVDDYLSIVDPYNTETQVRVAQLTGTVLYPTEGMRSLLGRLYRFAPSDVEDILDRPAVFYEALADDEPQLVNIGSLVPTPGDPTSKLHTFHGEMVSIQGIALGQMVRTEDIPKMQDLPVQFTVKTIGVVDLTGAMPVFGISSEDVSGEVFGFFRFELSVYAFEDGQAFAFLIRKEAVPPDPVREVERAEFGDRVQASLAGYVVTETQTIEVTSDLVLEHVDLLVPVNEDDPLIMTCCPDLVTGEYLTRVDVDGFMVDGQRLGLSEELLSEHGAGVIVVNASGVAFTKGEGPLPAPMPTTTPAIAPTPPVPRFP